MRGTRAAPSWGREWVMAYLVVLKGANAKESIRLDKDRILLGRNANCDVVFPANDFAVSREHACIVRVQDQFFIEDLGSRNGTFLNNQQVTARTPPTIDESCTENRKSARDHSR